MLVRGGKSINSFLKCYPRVVRRWHICISGHNWQSRAHCNNDAASSYRSSCAMAGGGGGADEWLSFSICTRSFLSAALIIFIDRSPIITEQRSNHLRIIQIGTLLLFLLPLSSQWITRTCKVPAAARIYRQRRMRRATTS